MDKQSGSQMDIDSRFAFATKNIRKHKTLINILR